MSSSIATYPAPIPMAEPQPEVPARIAAWPPCSRCMGTQRRMRADGLWLCLCVFDPPKSAPVRRIPAYRREVWYRADSPDCPLSQALDWALRHDVLFALLWYASPALQEMFAERTEEAKTFTRALREAYEARVTDPEPMRRLGSSVGVSYTDADTRLTATPGFASSQAAKFAARLEET